LLRLPLIVSSLNEIVFSSSPCFAGIGRKTPIQDEFD